MPAHTGSVLIVRFGSRKGQAWSRAAMFLSSPLRLSRLCRNIFRARWSRTLVTLNSNHELGDNFTLYLDVFNEEEQKILLEASLSKLDRAEDRQHRKRRKIFEATRAEKLSEPPTVKSLFLPDQHYDFQKVTWCLNSNVVGVV